MTLIKFQAGARGINSKPSYGGPIQYSESGSVVTGTPQVYGYLTYRQDQITGVASLVLDGVTEITDNLTPSVCSVVQPNVVTGLSAGKSISVVARTNGRLKRLDYRNATGDSLFTSTLSCAAGSLAKHIEDATLARLAGLTAGDVAQSAWSAYSAAVDGVTSATPNASSFVDGLNVSATSVWRSGMSDDIFPLMLVTARHAVTARHVCPPVGVTVTFRRPDGTFQSVTVDAVYKHPAQDLGLVHFNADVTGITPYKLCPLSTFDKINLSSSLSERLLCIVKALHRPDGTWKSYFGLAFAHYVAHPDSPNAKVVMLSVGAMKNRHQNADPVISFGCSTGIGGDSGSPAFWIIGGQLCLVGVWSMAGGILQSLVGIETLLNTEMNNLATNVSDPAAGTYAVQTVDLSGFTSYP